MCVIYPRLRPGYQRDTPYPNPNPYHPFDLSPSSLTITNTLFLFYGPFFLGSTSPRQYPCVMVTSYCPAGSVSQRAVTAGYYSVPEDAPDTPATQVIKHQKHHVL